MTSYIWSATDKSGLRVIKELDAATPEDAKYVLLAQGYSDLELKTNELTSAIRASFPKRKNQFGQELKEKPEDWLKHRDDPTATYWDALRKGITKDFSIFLALAFFLIYSGFRKQWGYFLIYGALLVAMLVYIIITSLQLIYYRKLIKAGEWHQWRKELSLVSTLEVIRKFKKVKLLASALTQHRAHAFVGLGRIKEGLDELKKCEGASEWPDWLYKLYVANLYGTAKQFDTAIEYTLASIAIKDTSIAWIDLANTYARFKGDPVKARAALVQAEKHPVEDTSKPFQIRCQGMIAYLEKNYPEAKLHLEDAIGLLEKAKGRPYRDGQLAIARAYLCCVLAKQGDLAGAKKCFAQAKKYLIATDEAALLAECRQLCGEK